MPNLRPIAAGAMATLALLLTADLLMPDLIRQPASPVSIAQQR